MKIIEKKIKRSIYNEILKNIIQRCDICYLTFDASNNEVYNDFFMSKVIDFHLDPKERILNYQETESHIAMKVDFDLIDKIKDCGSFHEFLEIYECSTIEFFARGKMWFSFLLEGGIVELPHDELYENQKFKNIIMY